MHQITPLKPVAMPWNPSKPPRKATQRSDVAITSKPWRDADGRFVMTHGVVKHSFIEFKIKRTRNSPALHFYMGQRISVVHGCNEYDVDVYSFTPRSTCGSDISASGVLRLVFHDQVERDLNGL
jgi:hypothetical protein